MALPDEGPSRQGAQQALLVHQRAEFFELRAHARLGRDAVRLEDGVLRLLGVRRDRRPHQTRQKVADADITRRQTDANEGSVHTRAFAGDAFDQRAGDDKLVELVDLRGEFDVLPDDLPDYENADAPRV